MKPGEDLASKIVVTVLSAERGEQVTADPWDQWPRQGVHDFWIDSSAGREALEITTIAEQDTKTHAMHWHRRGPGFDVMIEGLSCAWTITVDQQFKANTLIGGLAEWLLALETEGVTKTGRWVGDWAYTHAVTRQLVAAGVIEANALPGRPAGTVAFFYYWEVPSRRHSDPNHVTKVLTNMLVLDRHQKDAAKLGRSGADERHLFMWVDMTRMDVAWAFDEGTPTAAPVVDPNITTVWLAVPTADGAEVLRWSAELGWRRDDVTV